MKTTAVASLALLVGSFARAADPVPPTPALAPVAPVSLTAPPPSGLDTLWNSAGLDKLHVSGAVGVGVCSPLGHGFGCGPLIDTSASVNIFGEHAGVSIGVSDFTATSTRGGPWAPAPALIGGGIGGASHVGVR
jgi:hypothetical protein